MKVWIVQGIHPEVPGVPLRVFASSKAADREACALVRILCKDEGMSVTVTPSDWWEALAEYHLRRDESEGDVWVTETDLVE